MSREHERFVLSYDGPALTEHRISVEVLAPSLFALGKALREAQGAVAPGQPSASLDVVATSEGSFEVDLALTVPGLLDTLFEGLTGKHVDAILNAKELYGAVAFAVGLIVWRHRRRKVRKHVSGDRVTIIDDDTGEKTTLPRSAVTIAEHRPFQKAMDDVTKPLDTQGIDSMRTVPSTASVPTINVNKGDRAAFRFEEGESEIVDWQARVALEGTEFVGQHRWKFRDGTESLTATIEDQEFLDRVDAGKVPVRPFDELDVTIRTTTRWTVRGYPRSAHSVIEVQNYHPRSPQPTLPLAEDGDQVVDESDQIEEDGG